jgi:hypothetical protein
VTRPQDGDGAGPVLCDIGAMEARLEVFTDVAESHQFFADIAWMAEEGISTGFQPGPEYRPSDPVTARP